MAHENITDVWLLLYIPFPGLYDKTLIQSIYNVTKKTQLWLNCYYKFISAKNIIILFVSSDDFTHSNEVCKVEMKSIMIFFAGINL